MPSGRAPSANSAAAGDASNTPPSAASLLDADVVLTNEPPVLHHYAPHRPRDAQPPRAAAVPERQHQHQQAKAIESEPTAGASRENTRTESYVVRVTLRRQTLETKKRQQSEGETPIQSLMWAGPASAAD